MPPSPDDLRPIRWEQGRLRLLDQTRLPVEERWLEIPDAETMAEAIRSLRVRGAPAIGLAAAYGLAVEAERAVAGGKRGRALTAQLEAAGRLLAATRPTARNLFWALEAMERERLAWVEAGEDPPALTRRLLARAQALHRDDLARSEAMAVHGTALLPEGCEVLTHCNTGALATGGGGTALGVIRAAHRAGRLRHVWATETRPLLQGARLTTWELDRLGIPHTLIVDSAAAFLMKQKRVDAVLVGADRIAVNGDVANKIGTLALAGHARTAGIPFYVVAPLSTFDPTLPNGAAIPIEERGAGEVVGWGGVPTAPDGTAVWSPAFDITPAASLTAIVTERGTVSPVNREEIARLLERA